MARLKLPSVLLLVAVVLAAAEPGTASKSEPRASLTRFPPLLDCGPTSVAAPDGEFRANVLSLLREIPSAAAATPEPEGFVNASLGRADRDRAFARALCFGGANSSSAATSCRACLTAAARDAAAGCVASRRAGVWHTGCFLSYADTDALSAREDAFRGWFYADPDTTAATLEDRVCTGTDCDRCFKVAARAAAALPWLVRIRREVIVVGYSCCLRVQSYVSPITMDTRSSSLFTLMLMAVICQSGIVITVLLLVITISFI